MKSERFTQFKIWVLLARWCKDRIHVEFIGRQSQISCPAYTNMDDLIKIMIYDDAFRDETAHLGAAKLRVFKRIIDDSGLHLPVDELEPFRILDGLGLDGLMPLIVVAPPLDLQIRNQYPLMISQMPIDLSNFPMYAIKPKAGSKSIEERRKQDRLRQRKCRERKKVMNINESFGWKCRLKVYFKIIK
jgi:hypothetical protein